MNRHQAKTVKKLRIASQALFFGLFIYIFLTSLDPFSTAQNPFLRFDPLILLTHLRFQLKIILPVAGILTLTFITGRYFCGWVCPMGSLIDILDLLLKPIRKLNPFSNSLSFLKKWLQEFPPSLFVLGITSVTVFFTPPVLQFFHPNIWIIRIFSLSSPGIAFLGLLTIFSLFSRRLWCIYLCPLGAFYGLISRVSIFRLSINECSGCRRCETCPMDAAKFDTKTILDHQCILCFDFEHRCPVNGFSYRKRNSEEDKMYNHSRRLFLKQGAAVLGGLLLGTVTSRMNSPLKTMPLRPPGVSDEARFVEKCLRCFQCVRSCPNRIIKITGFESGLDNLFTPHLEFHEFGCDYNCQVCQLVCPNFAIPLQMLREKQSAKIGLASIDEKLCVVFARDTNCLVCEEFCPVPEKAIKVIERTKIVNGKSLYLRFPVMDDPLCIGCGICEAFCPVTEKAIKIRKI